MLTRLPIFMSLPEQAPAGAYNNNQRSIGNLCDALELHDLDQALNIIKSAIADLPTVVKKDMCENYYEGKGLLGWKVNLSQER